MLDKRKFVKFQIFSTIFILILGTLLHFTFEFSNNNIIVPSFSSVNESTWEHLKLVFFPMLITTIIGYFYFKKDIPNFICIKTIEIIFSICFITIFFYTYTGIIGTNFAILDIGSFFICVLLGEFIVYKKVMNDKAFCNKKVSILILVLLFLAFIIFTYFPPKINYFKDPVSGYYGIPLLVLSYE